MSMPTNKKAGETIATDDAITLMGGSDGAASRALLTDASGGLRSSSSIGVMGTPVTSPSAASTVVGPTTTVLGFQSVSGYALIQGATGGTLDVFIQTSFDSGVTWVDAVHFTQLAIAGPQVGWAFSLKRGGTAAPVSVNAASGTPTLAANTIAVGILGNALRYAFIAGVGTSAGASQTLQIVLGQ